MSNGEFGWSTETEELLAMLRKRLGTTLERPSGITPEERNLILGATTERIQAGERPAIEASKQQMARFGLAGTPAFEGVAESKIRRGTREQIADVSKGFSIDEINRRFQEFAGSSEIAGNLMSRLFTSEQIPEILSGARRAEGFRASDQMMQYLSILMGGQQGFMNPYAQALMARGNIQPGASSADWLPFMSYYMMNQPKAIN